MRKTKLEVSPSNSTERPNTALSVERVDPSEMDTVAKVLAMAYTEDPIHIWAFPRASTRLADATLFFTFYLRRMQQYSWDVFATSDRLAVVVASVVLKGKSAYPDGIRHLPILMRKMSTVTDYFQWIENFRPEVDHRYFEFVGAVPNAPRGTGSFLVSNVLKIFDGEGFPVWTWSSNPRNLSFYRRLGFEIGPELRRDTSTPPVTSIWRPPMPLAP